MALSREEISSIVAELSVELDKRYVTHDEQKTKIELVLGIDCTNADQRDTMRAATSFLLTLYKGAQNTGERVLLWIIILFGAAAFSLVFGKDAIQKLRDLAGG